MKDKDCQNDEHGKIICRCEEVPLNEIENAIEEGYTSLKKIKWRTRAGMGLCQGRTCSSIIRNMISAKTGRNRDEIKPDTARFPVYPISLKTLAKEDN